MEENTSLTTRSVGVKFGLYLGLISIVSFMIAMIAELDQQSGWNNFISAIIFIAIIFFAHKAFKEGGNGFMSYGQGVGISFWVAAVGGVISSVFMFIYIKFIDDSMLQKIKDKSIYDMEERGMTDEQIDQAMGFASMFMSPTAMLIMGIVGSIFMGVLIGLIVTIFTQKKDTTSPF